MSRVATHVLALRRAEEGLARALREVADRHRDDQEVFHVARDLAGWSQAHVSRLTRTVDRLPQGQVDETEVRREPVSLPQSTDDMALQLLVDLRTVYALANGVSLDWSLLEKYGHAVKDDSIVQMAAACGDEASRQASWALGMARAAAPQTLTQP